jgi:hypothetical protein
MAATDPRSQADDRAADLRVGAWLGLGAFLLVVLAGPASFLPSPVRMAVVLAWPVAAWLFELTGRAEIPIAYLVASGVVLRLAIVGSVGSDVMAATNEAIQTVLSGGNPYDHFYLSTIPPGSPMPYPPVELLVHLPGELLGGLRGVLATEAAGATALLVGLAWLAYGVSWRLGLPALGLYAGLGNLVALAVDGSNDTSTGALVLLALAALVWAGRRGWDDRSLALAGIAGAAALGTKQTTFFLLLLPMVAMWRIGGCRVVLKYLAVIVLCLLVVSLPFLAMGPLVYLRGLTSFVGFHQDVYGWNIWVFAGQLGLPVAGLGPAALVNVVATLVALLVALVLTLTRQPPTLSRAALAGLLVTLILLLTARWTSYAYFATVAPLILALPMLDRWEAAGPRHPLAGPALPAAA